MGPWLTQLDETLVLQREVSNLPKPSQRTLDDCRYWLKEPAILGGQSKYFLDAEDDLIALTAQKDVDPALHLLRRFWPAKSVSFRFQVQTKARRLVTAW